MVCVTPEDIETIKRRSAELMALIDEMVPQLNSLSIPEWVEIYKEREALEQRLGSNGNGKVAYKPAEDGAPRK